MSKHTPGPWTYTDASQLGGGAHHQCFYVHQADGAKFTQLSCDVGSVFWSPIIPGCSPKDTAEANARLIAAAPELLRVCKLALGAFEKNNAVDWGELESAIAKAEGREE